MDKKHGPGNPRGYVWSGGVWLPSSVARTYQPGEATSGVGLGQAQHDVNGAKAGQSEISIGTKPKVFAQAQHAALRRRVEIQVYRQADVDAMEEGAQALGRSNDRRRNIEMLASLLRKESPVGVRKLLRVRRNCLEVLDQLEKEMPNFQQVLATIRSLLSLQAAGDKVFQLPPILLAGDPGVGKTYFALRLAELMGLESSVAHMEGATSSMFLLGLEQHYSTAAPGQVFDALVRGKTANPMFVVDELDKASPNSRQPPANALYSLLEATTAKKFCDQSCPGVALDASRISWIVTANDLRRIPRPLISRMTVFDVSLPTLEQRARIAGFVYRDLRRQEPWGKRFECALPRASAEALARSVPSVRSMKSVLRMAFGIAYGRRSRAVESRDILSAIRCGLPLLDLEKIEPAGNA